MTVPPTDTGLPDLTGAYIASLRRSGPAWDAVVAAARSTTRPNLADQDSAGNVNALARALTGDRAGVIADLRAARASLSSVSRTLSLARELQPLPLAARIAGVTDAEVGFDLRAWFRTAIETGGLEGRGVADNVRGSARLDPTNWGSHARATVAWVAWYIGDPALSAEAWDNVRRYLTGGAGYQYKSDQVSWGTWTIAPAGTVKSGVNLDGAIHDIYRGGSFPTVGSSGTSYAWEATQGTISSAIAVDMAGHPEVWQAGDQAVLRSLRWLYGPLIDTEATGDDRWILWVAQRAYGTQPGTLAAPTTPGKGFGWTDWLYG